MRAVDTRALEGLDVKNLRGLEYGPLNRPKVYPEEGEVYYFDHASTEELQKKYSGHFGANEEALQPIHFVADGRSLVEILGNKAPLDYVIASHVIEHVPDLAGWLKDIHDALRVGGVLALWVPDKRFTWDIYRRLASFKEVAQAHEEKRQRPGLRLISDHFTYAVHAECWHLWENYGLAEDLSYIHGPEYIELIGRQYYEGVYIDVHNWVFTPWSFLDLMGKITSHFGLGFNLKLFQPTIKNHLDFVVQIEKVAGPSTTGWAAEADKVRETALWPEGGRKIADRLGLAM